MSAKVGYIYIAINPSLPGQVKIGATIHDPMKRMQQLSASTSIPMPFVLAYSRYVYAPFAVESALHDRFANHRINDSREFFQIPLHSAIEELDLYEEASRPATIDDLGDLSEYPFAALFATFDDADEDRTLTEDEIAQCRALEVELAR